MSRFLNREQSRRVDHIAIHEFGMSGLVLMENAAIGASARLQQRNPTSAPVLIVAGGGNNGGDGLAMARQLAIGQVPVAVLWIANPGSASDDCLSNWRILQHTSLPLAQVSPDDLTVSSEDGLLESNVTDLLKALQCQRFDWVVDAILGTGAKGAARAPIDQIIRWINQGDWNVLAVDLPSGLDCDEGLSGGEVVLANVTCTFVGQKQSFREADVQSVLGEVEVVSIGCPNEVLEHVLASRKADHGADQGE